MRWFIGTIPPDIGQLFCLTELRLSRNKLTGRGEIVYKLHNKPHAAVCRLTGKIPPEIGHLSDLEGLGLNDNKLTGGWPLFSSVGRPTPQAPVLSPVSPTGDFVIVVH
jgi:hypothetical protein